jgi:hypothetical protein
LDAQGDELIAISHAELELPVSNADSRAIMAAQRAALPELPTH